MGRSNKKTPSYIRVVPKDDIGDNFGTNEEADGEIGDLGIGPEFGGGDPPDGEATSKPKSNKKHRAKRFNEQLKSAYGFLNTLAAAVLLTGWIGPTIRGEPLPMGLDNPLLVIAGFGLHTVGQFLLLKLTRPEE